MTSKSSLTFPEHSKQKCMRHLFYCLSVLNIVLNLFVSIILSNRRPVIFVSTMKVVDSQNTEAEPAFIYLPWSTRQIVAAECIFVETESNKIKISEISVCRGH